VTPTGTGFMDREPLGLSSKEERVYSRIMNVEPNIDDFSQFVDRKLERARSELGITIKSICNGAAAKGSLRSGNTVHKVMQNVSDAMVSDIKSTITELDRISWKAGIGQTDLLHMNNFALQRHIEKVEISVRNEIIKHIAPRKVLDEIFQKIHDDRQFYIHQYKIVLFDLACDGRSTLIQNEINIGEMSGSNIQQGALRSNQSNHINNEIDSAAALYALDALDRCMNDAIADDAQLANVRADILALKGQLERPEVSTGVVREIGKSLRVRPGTS
jgi:hypothetical protein